MRIRAHNKREDGIAVLLVIILLVMMVGFVGMNAMALSSLKRELKLVERRQLLRAKAPVALTNSIPAPLEKK